MAAHNAQLDTTAQSAHTASETVRQDTFVKREQKIIGTRLAPPVPTEQPREELPKVLATIVLLVTTVSRSSRSLLHAQQVLTVTQLEAMPRTHPKVPLTLA